MVYNAETVTRVCLTAQGSNILPVLQFDVTELRAKWPEATFDIIFRRPGESEAQVYPVSTQLDGNILKWTVVTADVSKPGYGSCQIAATLADGHWYSKKITCEIRANIAGGSATNASTWVNDVLSAKNTATAASTSAATSAREAASSAMAASTLSSRAATAMSRAEIARTASESAKNSIDSTVAAFNTDYSTKSGALAEAIAGANAVTEAWTEDGGYKEQIQAATEAANDAAESVEGDIADIKSDLHTLNNDGDNPVDAGKIWLTTYNGAGWVDATISGGTIAQDPDDPNVGMVSDSTFADIDKSLTISGCAADAKVVGDKLSSVKSDFDKLLDSNKCSIQWYRGGCDENTGKWAGNSLYSVDTRTTMIHPSPMQMLEGDTIPCPNGYSVAIAIYKNWHNSDDFTFDSYVSRKEIPYTVKTGKSGYWFMPVYKTVNKDTLCDEQYSFKTAMFQLMRTITPMLSIASSYDSMARRVNALENQMETMARSMQSFTGGVLEKFDNISIVQTVKKNVDPDNASLFGIWLIRQANIDGMNGIPDSSGHAMLINIEQKSFFAASQFYIMVSGENAGTIYMRTKNKQSWSGVAWTTIGGASSEQV